MCESPNSMACTLGRSAVDPPPPPFLLNFFLLPDRLPANALDISEVSWPIYPLTTPVKDYSPPPSLNTCLLFFFKLFPPMNQIHDTGMAIVLWQRRFAPCSEPKVLGDAAPSVPSPHRTINSFVFLPFPSIVVPGPPKTILLA